MKVRNHTKTHRQLETGDVLWTPFGYEAVVMATARHGHIVNLVLRVLRLEGRDVDYIDASSGELDSITRVKTGFEQD